MSDRPLIPVLVFPGSNDDRDASLALAAKVFQTGLLERADAADVGYARVPLQRLHGDDAARALDDAGVAVHTKARVTEIARGRHGLSVACGGEAFEADSVILAVAHEDVAGLAPAGALPAGVEPERLGASPIVNLHVVYDRVVSGHAFAAGVGTPVQWVFDRTAASGLRSGQYVAVSVSAAEDVVDLPVAALQEVFVPEVRRLLPAARSATLLDFFVSRERSATFRPAPGSASYRPPTTTAYDGLFLAGAHCATGWPATMESAVRSGEAASAAALETSSLQAVAV